MQKPPHILVVEDSDHVTSALRILLESVAWRVSVAGSVIDALSMAQNDPPSVVLLDLTLPDGDGLRLVEPLRALGTRKIVVLSGHDDIDTKKRCFDAGCFDLLVKPVSVRDLVEKSRAWIAELE